MFLTKGIDHPDVTSLRSATIAGGVFDTCLTKGLFRVAGQPEGELTADAIEGQANEQSTSDVVSRILQFAGYSASDDYSQGDLDSLKLINPSPVGVYLTTQPSDLLTVLTQLLDSIGGYMVPNSSGILRFGRLSVPNSELDDSVAVLDTNVILDGGDGLERIATSDEGNGVPSHKITVSYNPLG